MNNKIDKNFYSDNFNIINKYMSYLLISEICFMMLTYLLIIYYDVHKLLYFTIFMIYFIFKLTFIHHIKNFSYFYEHLLKYNKIYF